MSREEDRVKVHIVVTGDYEVTRAQAIKLYGIGKDCQQWRETVLDLDVHSFSEDPTTLLEVIESGVITLSCFDDNGIHSTRATLGDPGGH